jgi:rubrerythrin
MQIVLTSIADEERVHAGELQTLINVINGDEFTQQNKGMKEVADVAGSTAAPQ